MENKDLTVGTTLDLFSCCYCYYPVLFFDILPGYVSLTATAEVETFHKTLVLLQTTCLHDDPFSELFYLSIFPCLLVLTGCTPEIG